MKPKVPQPKKNPARNESLWFAAAPLLAALLAVSIALYQSPARPVSSEVLLTDFSSAPGPAVDPVVHNIGKYVASHQILWPELSRHSPTPLSSPTANRPLRPHR